MNVCMDLQAALGQRGGIGRYVRELFRHLSAEAEEGETLTVRQQEVALSVLRQLELAAEARRDAIAREIPGLKSMRGRTFYVGDEKQFPKGCVSCLFGSGHFCAAASEPAGGQPSASLATSPYNQAFRELNKKS